MSNINSNDVLINIDNAESEISIINSKEITKSNSTIKNESLIENSVKINEDIDNTKKKKKKKKKKKIQKKKIDILSYII